MDEASLDDLAASIREHGVMQPILVRPVEGGRFELIAGERRWRAAQRAGLAEIPALVKSVPDQAALALALIENIQREDLNPLEQANGIQRLIDEFGLTHDAAAKAVGRSRSAVSNLLRLRELAKPVQEYLMDGRLDMGHARALLGLAAGQQIAAAARIVAQGLSVRETERLAHHLAHPGKHRTSAARARPTRSRSAAGRTRRASRREGDDRSEEGGHRPGGDCLFEPGRARRHPGEASLTHRGGSRADRRAAFLVRHHPNVRFGEGE